MAASQSVPNSPDTTQTEGEGLDSSDKPPHANNSNSTVTSRRDVPPHSASTQTTLVNGTRAPKPSAMSERPPKASLQAGQEHAGIPLLPPESGSLPKQPERSRKDLEHLVIVKDYAKDVRPSFAMSGNAPPGSAAPSVFDSPSPSDSECWSAPSTRPPSQAPSRAPSFSAGNASEKLTVPSTKGSKSKPTSEKTPSEKSAPPSRRPSFGHSDGGQKFTLKDLITAAPKLTRKSSNRSNASSKKSDSDGDRKSVAGESTVSLTQKYGVCQKIAIGKGATSVVRLAHKWDRSEERLYAVKEFRKRRKNESEKEYVKKLTAEFCISSTLHHVNIVETVDLVQDEGQRWCEVMEFCPGGDLYAAIKKGGMSPSEVECCFKQILNGVSYLHSQGVAHRDIKPENLFFDTKGHLKIGDYGASTVYRLPWETTIHMSTGLCGSEPYIAPEQFLGKPYDARLVDIWACGIIYYCLHFQEMPWRVAQQSDPLYLAYAQACSAPQKDAASFPPTVNNLSPRACRSLIRKMLEPDPKQRANIETVMAHPWLEGIEVCHAVEKPKHVHGHAMALAEAQVQVMT